MDLFRSEYGLQGAVGFISCQDPKLEFLPFHRWYRKSIPFPSSQVVVYLLIPSEASLRFSEHRFFFSGVGSSPSRPTPNLEDQGVPFCLVITFDLSGLGDPASSYATAGLALRII
jgi:hypothetical protein